MKTRPFSRSWFSPIVHYSTLVWTIFCILGTWFVILKYGILLKGLIAIVLTFLFAAGFWIIPFTGLILLSFIVDPPEESHPYVAFRELIKRGLRKGST